MPLKSKAGKLLSSHGHLCLTCCDQCSGPYCVDFGVLFPPVYPSAAPDYSPRSYSCVGFGYSTVSSTTYIKSLTNPLPVPAQFVVTKIASFDDDLEIDGVSLGGQCAYPTIYPVGTVLTSQPVGGMTILTVVDNYGVSTGGVGCACWVPVTPALNRVGIDIAKARFEVCKSCPNSPDGFSCNLVSGCCFGKKRTDQAFHCPKGSW